MDENLKIVYRLLYGVKKGMDYPDFDIEQLKPEEISRQRWNGCIKIAADAGLISGVKIQKNVLGELIVDTADIGITLKGLEYLQENSIMRKCHNLLKGIVDLIP